MNSLDCAAAADELDEVAAQESFEDKLKDVIEGLTEKRYVSPMQMWLVIHLVILFGQLNEVWFRFGRELQNSLC